MKNKELNVYTLDCKYWENEFYSVDALINAVIESGMDPNYEIMCNGESTGEKVSDLIVF
jgi:hypothetical protein